VRVAPFVGLGVIVSTYLAVVIFTKPVSIQELPHSLAYHTGVEDGVLRVVLYVVAVIGLAVLSGYPSIGCFGLLNLIGLGVVAVVYVEASASVWCIYAAAVSMLVMVHMMHRRRLSAPHRHQGSGPAPCADRQHVTSLTAVPSGGHSGVRGPF